ncbi:hypothetical protein K469DRAFT_559000 [Zopfia rhizophila CBS 207.26]|uniref:RGS domain-containing protein n=1 Tax=Zopfia rhizophila CBS 207.26 TaxID=1314779 RepID=A0A6A6EGR5_9PEZI|nr:hypothetical protein K469DRAFT_559000 [Zopfia rhizophila CBS 207.26]
MVYSLTYRRPSHVSSRQSLSGEERQQSINESIQSASSGMSHGIPESLSFDHIIAGGVCPPCTTRDFINYLKYIELSAENLQFFLWYRDYCRRFSKLDREKDLSKPWTPQHVDDETPARPKRLSPETAAAFKGTDFTSDSQIAEGERANPFFTPPRTSNDQTPSNLKGSRDSMDAYEESSAGGRTTNHTQRASDAFQSAGLKWKPLSIQPYRGEITRIISIYIADGGARQLNLSAKERTTLLHALQHTTHPSAFEDIIHTVEWTLRCQAHPNFIRWTICNGNRLRVVFARGLGVGGIVAGFVIVIVLTLSSASRAWRVLSLIAFFIGVSTLIAAWKGMCVVLHGMHHRHLRPWELFTSDDELASRNAKNHSYDSPDSQESSNSFEDEPWVAKYEKRNLIRKVFDREVWIQEPALRHIQDTIFLQSIIGALILSIVIAGIFCAFPQGNFF